jgi:hypothetical protein
MNRLRPTPIRPTLCSAQLDPQELIGFKPNCEMDTVRFDIWSIFPLASGQTEKRSVLCRSGSAHNELVGQSPLDPSVAFDSCPVG